MHSIHSIEVFLLLRLSWNIRIKQSKIKATAKQKIRNKKCTWLLNIWTNLLCLPYFQVPHSIQHWQQMTTKGYWRSAPYKIQVPSKGQYHSATVLTFKLYQNSSLLSSQKPSNNGTLHFTLQSLIQIIPQPLFSK